MDNSDVFVNSLMDGKSLDISRQRKNELKQLFPSVFTETLNTVGELVESVDFERLKAELGEFSEVYESRREKYGMDWPGKRDALKLIQSSSRATLKPCREESVDFDNTENLFIEGDNLEVLKLLQKSYYGKVKMIYIDPPYNTGKEFIYPDKYSESLNTYLSYAGLLDDVGRKFTTNAASEGRFHTKWLNMMYPRLYLARNLLRDDGVIFISIDDNEAENLHRICDEIFGEENFLCTLIWKRRVSSAMADKNVSTDHEYVFAYQKGDFSDFLGYEKDFKKYSNPDEDPRGDWISDNLTVGMNSAMRPNQAYDLVDPSTGKVYPFNPNRVWAFVPESMEKMIQEGRIIFPEDTTRRPMQKRFRNELKSNFNPVSTLMMDKVGMNTEATRTIQEIMGENIFEYSKPVSLLTTLIPQVCNKKGDICLDFFAGSAFTAHAAMDLNATDEMARKFIMVQLPEPCEEKSSAYKAGYINIAEIGKERIRRVAKKIKEENPNYTGDLGFKVLKLDRSNFKQWQAPERNASENDLLKQLELHIDHVQEAADPEAILYELLIKAGFMPTEKVETLRLAGKVVYSIAEGALLICLEEMIENDLIQAVADAEPAQFICLDKAFGGNDQLKANAVQTFKALNEDREVKVEFRTV